MNRNNNFIAVKTRENARDYACCKSATAGLGVVALLQICNCRVQRVKAPLSPEDPKEWPKGRMDMIDSNEQWKDVISKP